MLFRSYLFLLLRLAGSPTIEHCSAWFPPDGSSEQRLSATLRYGDIPVLVVGSSDSAGTDEVEFTVRGSERSYRLTNWYQYATADRGGTWNEALSPAESAGPAAFAAQLDQLSRLIRGEPNSLATFAEALEVQRVVEALLDRAVTPGT